MINSVHAKAGVMGWPIDHSLSPRLHGFWLKNYGIAGSYDAFAVKSEDFAAALRSIAQKGLRGVNLTVPHKEAACALVNALDPAARRIGAVNLVTVDDKGKLLGRNTDAYGFTQNLAMAEFKPGKGAAFVLGAGGACRAVLVALEDMGFSEIRIANRTKARAEKLASEFSTVKCKISALDWQYAPSGLQNTDILVNTTSLGMTGQPPLDFALDELPQAAFVADIVYAPIKTELLNHAALRGHKVIDGLGMLLHQARPSFAAFFGRDPEVTDQLRDYVGTGKE